MTGPLYSRLHNPLCIIVWLGLTFSGGYIPLEKLGENFQIIHILGRDYPIIPENMFLINFPSVIII